jgi:hypothetical protein
MFVETEQKLYNAMKYANNFVSCFHLCSIFSYCSIFSVAFCRSLFILLLCVLCIVCPSSIYGIFKSFLIQVMCYAYLNIIIILQISIYIKGLGVHLWILFPFVEHNCSQCSHSDIEYCTLTQKLVELCFYKYVQSNIFVHLRFDIMCNCINVAC